MLELRVAGELDMTTAPQFATEVSGKLERRPDRDVVMDLSGVGFMDCAGARTLGAVLTAIPAWHLRDLRGVRPQVSRVLDLVGVELPRQPRPDEVSRSPRLQEALARSYAAQAHSRQIMARASRIMTQLAITYSEMAAATQRRAGLPDTRQGLSGDKQSLSGDSRRRAVLLEHMSDAARELSAHCRPPAYRR
jgi:anti-anti-sigma factor